MKVNNIFLVTLFTTLIVASLGLAHPAAPSLSPNVTSSASIAPQLASIPQVANLSPQEQAELSAVIQGGGLKDLSKECMAALLQLVADPKFLKCVPLDALIALTPLLDPSIIQNFLANPAKNYPPLQGPLVKFATGLCPAPKCADADVDGAIKLIGDGCKADLAANNQLIQTIFTAIVFYSPLRDSICFKDGKTFCFDETILNVISLPPAKPEFAVTKSPILDSVIVGDPAKICTKCNEDIVNTIIIFLSKKAKDPVVQQILKQLGVDDKKQAEGILGAAVKCGQDFVSGKIP